MNYGKAVEEVWEWREAIEKQLEGMSPEQQRNHLNNMADEAIRKYGIKVRRLPENSTRRRSSPGKVAAETP